MEEIFSGYQAISPQFKVVHSKAKERRHVEEGVSPTTHVTDAEVEEGRRERGENLPRSRVGHYSKRRVDPREGRTVFVGNLPVSASRRKLRQLFSQHGKIVSVRLRSMVVEKGKLPVKIAKRQHKQVSGSTLNAYVVYESDESAEKALALNGAMFGGERHMRVDLAGRAGVHEHKRSVFVGNLPYNVDEEEVRVAFSKCGEVESVRLVRESKTGLGKGFGFVTFEDRSGVMFALQQNSRIDLNGKKLRIFKSKDMTQARKPDSRARFSGLQARKKATTSYKGIKMKQRQKH